MLKTIFKEEKNLKTPFLFVPFLRERDDIGKLLPLLTPPKKQSPPPQKSNQTPEKKQTPFLFHFKISEKKTSGKKTARKIRKPRSLSPVRDFYERNYEQIDRKSPKAEVKNSRILRNKRLEQVKPQDLNYSYQTPRRKQLIVDLSKLSDREKHHNAVIDAKRLKEGSNDESLKGKPVNNEINRKERMIYGEFGRNSSRNECEIDFKSPEFILNRLDLSSPKKIPLKEKEILAIRAKMCKKYHMNIMKK